MQEIFIDKIKEDYKKSLLWGSLREQKILELLTIYETSFKRKTSILFVVRVISFLIMVWLVTYDISMKNGFQYQKYTEWGEASTLFAFTLLVLISKRKLSQEKSLKNGE